MIRIFGVVGRDVHSKDIIPQIQAEKGETVKVLISSPGGSVLEGFAIYDTLKMLGKRIEVSIMGQALSIASIIAMAGDKIEMGKGAVMMIHNSLSGRGGNAVELEKTIDLLKGSDERMMAVYKAKSGLTEDQITEMMSKETFMNAEQAQSHGFITDIQEDLKLVALATMQQETQQEKSKVEKVENKEVSPGMIAYIGKMFGLTPKDIKAEGEENAPAEENNEDETVKAMEEMKKENEALKAKVSAMEEDKKTSETVKAEEDEKMEVEAKAKTDIVFAAMQEDKITLAEGKDYFDKNMEEIEKLKDMKANASGYSSKGEPNKEPASGKVEEWKALPAEKQFAFYDKHEDEILKEMEEAKA